MASSPRCTSAIESMFGPVATQNAAMIAATIVIAASPSTRFIAAAATPAPIVPIWNAVNRPMRVSA